MTAGTTANTPLTLHADVYGPTDAEPLVLLGSLGSTTEMWLPQLDGLCDDRRVIALDHRGHGKSPLTPAGADGPTVPDLAADVLHTLDGLGVAGFTVVGLSLGGAVAQYLAATSDRVTAAVFICTAAKFGDPSGWVERAHTARTDGVGALADAVITRWFSPAYREQNPATTDHYRDMIAATPDEGYAACCDALSQWDFTSRLGEVTVPTLVVAGEHDPSTAPETVKVIADGVAGSSYVVLSPAAHLPNLEQPQTVNGLIRGFLAG
ncbi:3-oxoadipate enol-lactonase [Corynebacterium sp.]|uniref:3-oxoadipate enol-lactonase n=1 Tax=Corynebacterium sp. TaxID=1720 RepID=UPI003B3A9FD6